jgi:hypothetical protein
MLEHERKKKMKKYLSLALALAMLFSLTGCSEKLTNKDLLLKSMEAGQKIETMTQSVNMEMTASGLAGTGLPLDEVTSSVDMDMKADTKNEKMHVTMTAKAMGMSFDMEMYTEGDEIIYKAPGSPMYIKTTATEMSDVEGKTIMPNLDMTEFTEASNEFMKDFMDNYPDFISLFVENSDDKAVKEKIVVNEQEINAYKTVTKFDNGKLEKTISFVGDYLVSDSEGRKKFKNLLDKYPLPIVEMMDGKSEYKLTDETFDADLIKMGEEIKKIDLSEINKFFSIEDVEITSYYNEKFETVKYAVNMSFLLNMPEMPSTVGIKIVMDGEVYDINSTELIKPEIPEDQIMTMEEYMESLYLAEGMNMMDY